MKYAIIAAGEGSRLAAEGVTLPKPLVEVGGESLLERLIRIFMQHDATEISVVCNEQMTQVAHRLAQLQQDGLHGKAVPLHYVAKSTPSSMHSFHALAPYLEGSEAFVLTTVDTIFREEEFSRYVAALSSAVAAGYDGLMGVTDFVDDEKPLYVGTDENMDITGFFDTPNGCRYISGGIYGLTPAALATLSRCVERGESRMRNFQRALVADGQRLRAHAFGQVLDIDHRSDIEKAEDLLRP